MVRFSPMSTGVPSSVTVLLVEDDVVHGAHLSEAVARVPGAAVTSWLKCVDELRARLADAATPPPNLVLLDLGLPGGSGIPVVREVRERWPSVTVLVVSVLADERSVVESIRNGSSGYIVKDGDGLAVTRAIANVLAGQFPISPAVARHLIANLSPRAATKVRRGEAELTDREQELLRHIAEGLSYAEAAEALGVAHSTVESHIRNLYRKLEAHSKSEAVSQARARGLL